MKTKALILIIISGIMISCNQNNISENKEEKQEFTYLLEQFADLRIMRYQVPEFELLDVRQKKLVYFLTEAALAGRDIIYDQNYKHNLSIRKTLEEVVKGYDGDRTSVDFENFMIYTKRVWFSAGIHHHYSMDKFYPEISTDYFKSLLENTKSKEFPFLDGENKAKFIDRIRQIIFDPTIAPKRVNQEAGMDMVETSATNFYEGVSQEEVEDFYNKMKDPTDETPISYGLNSKVVKVNGKIQERVYKVGAMYGQALERMAGWMDQAATVAENDIQRAYIETLAEYFRTGNLKLWDEYSIAWAQDLDSRVDFVNGFIENYGDPMGMKATFESIVNFKDIKASRRSDLLAQNAQWFEDNSPVNSRFKKEQVKGVSSKVITATILAGDCYPSPPIGINLPNPDWIRAKHGSKSVTIENLTYAYDQAALGNGFMEEFAASKEEIALNEKYGSMASNLHTDMHECLGHASGKVLPGVSVDVLKNYQSPLEEARADLFALYYMMDNKMVDLGILPSLDAAKSEYTGYIRNGAMTQLTRIEPGKNVEQAHMRCRKLIAEWSIERGKKENVIERFSLDGKTYFKVNDFYKLRLIFGELLAEIQRIKSEGDYEAGKKLVENYAINVDPALHLEVLDRYSKLHIAPYGGFINPVYVPVLEGDKIIDISMEYKDDFTEQNLYYSDKYSFLPPYN